MPLKERKLCIVFSTSGGSFEDQFGEYMIFVVDLKLESGESGDEIVTLLTPTVRLDVKHFDRAAFCVLGSTLYVFDGCSPYGYDREYNPEGGGGGGKSMYMYQLSDGISNLKLEKDMLSVGPDMNEIKINPKVIVAPNGKILVFSRTIYYSSPHECHFEMYDPVDGVWEKLPILRPSLLFPGTRFDDFDIESFTFMEGNVFFMKTEKGAFTLDITARNKVWKIDAFYCDGNIPNHTCDSLVVINKEICIIPYTAFDITKYEGNEDVFSRLFYEFPDLSEVTNNYSYKYGGGVVLLKNCAEVFTVCLLDTGKNKKTKDLELLLQVYSCNLKECRKELRKYRKKKIEEHPNWRERKIDIFEFPGAKKVKTLRIGVKAGPELFFSFDFCSYASIPPIEIAQESII